jgi:hypothetical protein
VILLSKLGRNSIAREPLKSNPENRKATSRVAGGGLESMDCLKLFRQALFPARTL